MVPAPKCPAPKCSAPKRTRPLEKSLLPSKVAKNIFVRWIWIKTILRFAGPSVGQGPGLLRHYQDRSCISLNLTRPRTVSVNIRNTPCCHVVSFLLYNIRNTPCCHVVSFILYNIRNTPCCHFVSFLLDNIRNTPCCHVDCSDRLTSSFCLLKFWSFQTTPSCPGCSSWEME